MGNIYIFGHKNPDTDTVVASISCAEFMNYIWKNTEPVILWEINNETRFLLEKFWYKIPTKVEKLPEWSKVLLVDHNEATQTIDNIKDLDIIGLVDHHKFWWFSTSNPIFCRVESIWSTASVIAKIMRESWFKPSSKLAGIMIWAIISDTLFFRSPTTTDEDKKIVEELNKIAEIRNLEDFSMQMFKAKSDLWNISIDNFIKLDYKEFDFNWTKLGIWVIETVDPDYSLNRKQEILEWLKKIKIENKLDLIYICIIDILKESNLTFVIWDEESNILKQIYWKETIDNICDLWNIISRKKQIVPKLTDFFDNK